MESLKEKAIKLQSLLAQERSLEIEIKNLPIENEQDYKILEIRKDKLRDIANQIGKINIWFAERGDKVRTEI